MVLRNTLQLQQETTLTVLPPCLKKKYTPTDVTKFETARREKSGVNEILVSLCTLILAERERVR